MVDEVASEDREDSLYLTQIRHLDEQLERCQIKSDELETKNMVLLQKDRALQRQNEDVTHYLKYTLALREKKVKQLVVQLEEETQTAEQETEELKKKHRLEEKELQDQIDNLNFVRMRNVVKMEEQEEQRKQLMEQLQQLPSKETLEKQLVHEEKEHKASTQRLQRDLLKTSDKILTEVMTSPDTLEEISECVRRERAEHRQHMEKVNFMMEENKKLKKHRQHLQFNVAKLSETDTQRKELDTVKKVVFANEKSAEELTKTCRPLEKRLTKHNNTYKLLLAEEEALRVSVASALDECDHKKSEAIHLKAELQEQSARRRKVEADMQEAVSILRHILKKSEKLTEENTQRLLEILDSTTHGPQRPGSDLETSDPKTARALQSDDVQLCRSFCLSHC